jgi:hypothetical protein
LSQKPCTYDDDSISKLLQRLRAYEITKGEMIMILNLRPTNPVALNTVIEDMEDRFDQAAQEDIALGIGEVLGQFPEDDGAEEGDDVMDTTEPAR